MPWEKENHLRIRTEQQIFFELETKMDIGVWVWAWEVKFEKVVFCAPSNAKIFNLN